MTPDSPWTVAPVAGSALVLLGCVFGLSVAGVSVGWRLAYAFLSAGLVCFLEIALRRRPHPTLPRRSIPLPPWQLSEQDQRKRWEAEQELKEAEERRAYREKLEEVHRRRITDLVRSLTEITLLICLAFYIGYLGHRLAGPLVPDTHRDGSNLAVCQNDLAKTKAELGECRAASASGNRSDDLERKLLEALKRPPSPAPPPPTSLGFGLSWGWVLVAIIALIVVGLLAKTHKEVVPVAGAAGLATEALHHANELAKMNEQMYWRVLGTFLAVSGMLVLLFLSAAIIDLQQRATAVPAADSDAPARKQTWREWVGRLFGKPDGKPESSKENYLSTLGFSVLVLLWAAVIVGYRVPEHDGKVVSPAVVDRNLESLALKPLGPFREGRAVLKRGEDLKPWEDYLATQTMHRGDILLLLGSTDCKAFRKGGDGRDNPTLARDRAKQVMDWLKGPMDARGVKLDLISVQQQERCREFADLRTVYPFLIRATDQ